MIVARDDTRYGIAWTECDCCGEQGDPVPGHAAIDLRTDNVTCRWCEGQGCDCLAQPSRMDATHSAYRGAVEQLERVAGELESAIDAFILAEQQLKLLDGDELSDMFDELDARAINALGRVNRAPSGIDPASSGT